MIAICSCCGKRVETPKIRNVYCPNCKQWQSLVRAPKVRKEKK